MRTTATDELEFSQLPVNGSVMPHVPSMKLLGVVIQHILQWGSQVKAMVTKANIRRYFIIILKRAGVQFQDLVKCHCTFIRPMLEHADPVWYPWTDHDQSNDLGQVQRQCRSTLIPDASHREVLRVTGLQKLEEQWTQLCLNFAKVLPAANSSAVGYHLRESSDIKKNLRNNYKLSLLPSRTRRLDRSPIANLVHLLNIYSIYL